MSSSDISIPLPACALLSWRAQLSDRMQIIKTTPLQTSYGAKLPILPLVHNLELNPYATVPSCSFQRSFGKSALSVICPWLCHWRSVVFFPLFRCCRFATGTNMFGAGRYGRYFLAIEPPAPIANNCQSKHCSWLWSVYPTIGVGYC